MKLQLALCSLLALSLASCENDTTTTATTTSDTSTAIATGADPNMITTTTTTTTTRPAFQPQPNVQYLDVRTKKMIKVRVDTVHHYIVNTETNQPVDFIVQPGSTDTFYGRNMQMANGYINYSDWTYDEARASSSMSGSSDMNTSGSMSTSGSDVDKMKSNNNETKVKYNDGSKVKMNDNEVKAKGADGSKIKSNDNETKIKNK